MSGKSMDVFSLRDSIVGEYRKFATSFTTIHAGDIREQVEAISRQGRFWPDPLIQINPSYKRGCDVDTLIAAGALEPRVAEIIRADGVHLTRGAMRRVVVAASARQRSWSRARTWVHVIVAELLVRMKIGRIALTLAR